MRPFAVFKTITLVTLSVPATVAIAIGPLAGDVTDHARNEGSGIAPQVANRAGTKAEGLDHLEARSATPAIKLRRGQGLREAQDSPSSSQLRGNRLGCPACASSSSGCSRCTETLREQAAAWNARSEQDSALRAKADAVRAQHDAALSSRLSVLSKERRD
ncbi:hypothetical protein PpBr36_03814 [Pyricularia pennisetigena]|uniref:hypothetical protein n=1 Tax=Pyricularia pennisetigena TaxID=1578925 RepID=UPI001152DE26|nr:hypothetical protein PpBr36_03814 [Pyricularia pennisetigena]TLS31101.1 hypothetical protein PpBr36_03814 [Pyricularia pennisetigena]